MNKWPKFKETINKYARTCSECKRTIGVGEKVLVSTYQSKYGENYKYVCSEDCRLSFDNRFWQSRAFKVDQGEELTNEDLKEYLESIDYY